MAIQYSALVIALGYIALASAGPISSARTAVGKCPAVDPATPVFLPDSESCSIYYECSNGVPIQNECPPDLEFNPILKVCDFPIDSGCSSSKTVIVPFTAVGTCPPRDTDVTIYLPDSDDCSIYYVCSNGRPIKAACAPGMLWNANLNTCDWELDVDCPNKKFLARTVVGKCPAVDPATPVFLPDSDSCTIYYECSNGVAVQNECPPGLEFNTSLRVCDFPLDSGCNISGIKSSGSP